MHFGQISARVANRFHVTPSPLPYILEAHHIRVALLVILYPKLPTQPNKMWLLEKVTRYLFALAIFEANFMKQLMRFQLT